MRHLLLGFGALIALSASVHANPPGAGCSSCGPATGGCSTGWVNPFARFGTSSCGCGSSAPSLFSKGCDSGCGSGCNTFNLGIWDWIKSPCPSSAPSHRAYAPLGFPTSPYVRSPRDYFMVD
ncbi:MAG: hypothetical protein K1X57_02455 [Gemmataceae bacterium]|nr:hypothetical protein [Gemmataceae bacterium]